MIPKRPFLLRAFYDWIAESNMTPHILVNAEAEEVNVPKQHIKDGKIVLNVSPMAVQDFMMDNEALSFSARFGGVAFYIYCPMYSIEAIYARESPADGISFSPDEYADVAAPAGGASDTKPALAALSAVDNHADVGHPDEEAAPVAKKGKDSLAGVNTTQESDAEASDDSEETPPPRKRPALRVVK